MDLILPTFPNWNPGEAISAAYWMSSAVSIPPSSEVAANATTGAAAVAARADPDLHKELYPLLLLIKFNVKVNEL